MQLKDKGDTFTVAMTVPETKTLEKAWKIISKIAIVPCDEAMKAADIRDMLRDVIDALAPAAKAE